MDADKYTQMMDATEKLFAASQPVNTSAKYKSNPNDDITYWATNVALWSIDYRICSEVSENVVSSISKAW